jgi:DNA-binding MarR family transcriptional regulator
MTNEESFKIPVEGRLFLQAFKSVIDKIDRDLRQVSPLSLTEFEVLSHVDRSGGRMRFVTLAEKVKISQSRVSRQIDSLTKKGYVCREITAHHRRATFAIITKLGQTTYDHAKGPFIAAWQKHFFEQIPAEYSETFKAVMINLIADPDLLPPFADA